MQDEYSYFYAIFWILLVLFIGLFIYYYNRQALTAAKRMIKLINLTKSYPLFSGGRHYVFKNFTFEFPENCSIGLMGVMAQASPLS